MSGPKYAGTVDTPYTSYEATEVDYARCGSLIVLVHPMHPPHQIKLDLQFDQLRGIEISQMDFKPSPWFRLGWLRGKVIEMSLSVSNFHNKEVLKVTSPEPLFTRQDEGRNLQLLIPVRSWSGGTHYTKGDQVISNGYRYEAENSGVSGKEWDAKVLGSDHNDGGVHWRITKRADNWDR